jgi:hypothetical protein
MSLVELHPEELLDRAQKGALTTAERRDLAAHLRRCAACVAERRWAADAAAAVEREEAGADRARTDRLVAAVMNRRRGAIAAAVAAMDAGRPRSRRAAVVMALVAGGCLLSGAAAATLWPAARRLWVTNAEVPAAPAARPSPPVRAEQMPAMAATPPAEPAPAPVAPAKIAARAARPAPVTAPPATAATVFGELARARRAGRLVEARQAHDLLVERFPGTREERAGRLLVAQLALRRDEPGVALDLFERYLGTDVEGALAEEARLGRALALERLGRAADERRAWRELLERHPRSIHAARARARLESLGAAPPR